MVSFHWWAITLGTFSATYPTTQTTTDIIYGTKTQTTPTPIKTKEGYPTLISAPERLFQEKQIPTEVKWWKDNIEWYRHRPGYPDWNNYMAPKHAMNEEWDIILAPATYKDSGEYKCIIIDQDGQYHSKTSILEVFYLPTLSIYMEEHPGDTKHLPIHADRPTNTAVCRGLIGSPQIQLFWFIDGKPQRDTTTLYSHRQGEAWSTLSLEQTHNGALVTCIANNSKIDTPTSVSRKATLHTTDITNKKQIQSSLDTDMDHSQHIREDGKRAAILLAGMVATLLTITLMTWMRSKTQPHHRVTTQRSVHAHTPAQQCSQQKLIMRVTTV